MTELFYRREADGFVRAFSIQHPDELKQLPKPGEPCELDRRLVAGLPYRDPNQTPKAADVVYFIKYYLPAETAGAEQPAAVTTHAKQ